MVKNDVFLRFKKIDKAFFSRETMNDFHLQKKKGLRKFSQTFFGVFYITLESDGTFVPKIKERNFSFVNSKLKNHKMERPKFNHEIINELYQYGWTLHQANVLPTILELPRQSLIEDLTKVIEDGIDNFSEYERLVEIEETLTWENVTFVQHAIYILAEIEATEAKGIIEKILLQPEEFAEFFTEEFDTEELPMCLMRIFKDDYELYTKIAIKANYWINSSACTTAMSQMVLYNPDLKPLIVPCFENIILTLTEKNKVKKSLDNATALGCLVGDLIDMKVRDLDEVVKAAFDADVVDESLSGDYQDYIDAFEEYPDWDYKRPYTPILKYYRKWDEIIAEREEEEAIWKAEREQREAKRNMEMEAKARQIEKQKIDINKVGKQGEILESGNFKYKDKKVGRNEPCPCGSGKKYKKCHGK
jgi:hypothetical protein